MFSRPFSSLLLQTFLLGSQFPRGERSNIEAAPQQWPDQFRAKTQTITTLLMGQQTTHRKDRVKPQEGAIMLSQRTQRPQQLSLNEETLGRHKGSTETVSISIQAQNPAPCSQLVPCYGCATLQGQQLGSMRIFLLLHHHAPTHRSRAPGSSWQFSWIYFAED